MGFEVVRCGPALFGEFGVTLLPGRLVCSGASLEEGPAYPSIGKPE